MLRGQHLVGFGGKQPAAGGAAPTPDILWWKFTDGSGTTVTADVGPNGTISGATWVTGKSGSGYALSFDGTNDTLLSASNVTYGTDVVTVTCWVKCPQTQMAASWINIVRSSEQIKSQDHPGWTMSAKGGYSYNLEGIIKSSSWGAGDPLRAEYDSSGLFPDDVWTHVAMVFDAPANSNAGEIKIYVDGSLVSTTIGRNTKTVSANYTADTIRVMFCPHLSYYTEGSIDDLRIYSGELDATQIAAVYAEEY